MLAEQKRKDGLNKGGEHEHRYKRRSTAQLKVASLKLKEIGITNFVKMTKLTA